VPLVITASTAIREVEFFHAKSTRSVPIADATHQISEISFIITRITLASGVTGEAYLLSFHYSPHAMAGALKDIRALALGADASRPGEFVQHFNREAEYFGNAGIHRWACGSINIAMWDAWAKTLGQPVWRLFGTYRDRIPLYGSGGWLTYSVPELLDEVSHYIRRGFRAVKIKVGSKDIEADKERLCKVREAVGPHIEIMMDANQGMDLSNALRLAAAVRPLRITWFEASLSYGFRRLPAASKPGRHLVGNGRT
jgi:L-alanine-DL-glutamate epimerase-like enolase superfamily enzyme